jgi:hypothetical protein
LTESPRPSRNQLLAALPEQEYSRLEPYLINEPLTLGTILHEASEKVNTFYFPSSALISLVNILSNGTTTEIGIIGTTGMVNLPSLIGDGYSSDRAIVQMAGNSLKISALILKQEFDRGEQLQKIILNYTQIRLRELGQPGRTHLN